eukprot:TRINITY_DN41675_c0_g1_i1.p1 TRINITY_DN41675_c0_g1~~TRINITY_DN41675_c0_g1_i1.p1  ORF type:complete len:570 (+),score=136.51 TRINITY_DN41675_c0_g1_i1:89-1798(+)
MAQMWEVVGGKTGGGIMVRTGRDLKSAEAPERLSTGAKIKELALEGERLNYELVTGTGPAEGWISLKLKDKELVVPVDTPEGPPRKLPEWKKVAPAQFEYGEMRERAGKNLPGDYHGMTFPHSEAQLMDPQWGVKWLTKAFIKTGAMTPDNEVTEMSMQNVTGDVSGGAGLKYLLKVKYKKDKPYLHTDLFVKLPHEPKGSDRYFVSVMWGHDRPETIFNIWLNTFVPFKVPKMYFCDINKDSTNFILITEQIKFAKLGEKTEFGPGDIEPAYNKYSDFEMRDGGPMYYLAACKNLGKMAAYHKTGRLHPDVEAMFPMPDPVPSMPKDLPGTDATAKKQAQGQFDLFHRFMSETAVNAFPKEITSKAWLDELKSQIDIMRDFGAEIHCFSSGCGMPTPNDYIVLTHNNLQVDNCIYHHDDANELQVGMLDWGVLACGPFISSIMMGCVSGAQVDVFIEYYERFVQAAVDSYHEHGGPKLDMERMKIASELQVCGWVCGLAANTQAVLKDVKVAEWASVTDVFEDERVQKKWNAKAWASQFHNALLIYQKLEIYKKFQAWLKAQDFPPQK